ncbi:hypothetical protein [Psychroserpens ponticola]|uniref:Uncharacterized protein n=1 Tax=Psychroserpens ponticola TaxID=2932268 RepID=A0ABY7S3H5_9FLAO|nr:hypothetical protein [Psychroserpens ponticola]WCO03527.1 hypothetical protein MUN68_008465 [Psychroserpens ponticola]
MKKEILTLLLIFYFSSVFGQNSDRTYLKHNHNYSTTYSYEISEITIHSDSTFTWKSWKVNNKKKWKTYQKYKPEVSNGKITQNGEFYTLTEYRNGNKTNFNWTVKISNKRLSFYHPSRNGKIKKITKYKRIE